MEHIINRTQKYHQAKEGVLADGIFSSTEVYDSICGLILFLLKCIKEDNYLPHIEINQLQKQKNYLLILKEIKKNHFKKMKIKDEKIFFTIFMVLELNEKTHSKISKI